MDAIRICLLYLCSFALLIGNLLPARAQLAEYPSRPVTVVVPFGPGTAIDGIARTLAEPLSTALGQPVVIANIPGADGAVAGERVATGSSDGHTLLLANREVAERFQGRLVPVAQLHGTYKDRATGYTGPLWVGLFGPSGLSDAVVARIENALQNAQPRLETVFAAHQMSVRVASGREKAAHLAENQSASVAPHERLEVAGLRLGQTLEEVKQRYGAQLEIFARYRSHQTQKLPSVQFLGAPGWILLQFEEGIGLTELNFYWEAKNDSERAERMLNAAEYSGISKTEVEKDLRFQRAREEQARKLGPPKDMEDLVRRMKSWPESGSTFRSAPGQHVSLMSFERGERFDVVLSLSSTNPAPRRPARGEEPIEDIYTRADQGFEESLRRASKAQGFFSAYHGVYAITCDSIPSSGSQLGTMLARMNQRLRILVWSEGQNLFMHTGTSVARRNVTVLADRGPGTYTFGDLQERLHLLEIDERVPNRPPSKALFLFGSEQMYAGDDLSKLKRWKKCEKV